MVPMKLEGIHHITAITADAQRNVDFYVGVMGLRLVKKTVNQDDPTVYHLFFADEKGDAGSDLTFFEYPGAPPGRAGDGMIHTIAWRVASSEAFDFWAERLGTGGDQALIADHPEIASEVALQGFDGARAYSSNPEASRKLFEEALGFQS